MSRFSTAIDIVLEILTRAMRQEKKIKGIQIRNEKFKLSLFADDMIFYLAEPKDSINRLQGLIRAFDRVHGYKINEHKLMALVCTNNPITVNTILTNKLMLS